MYSFVEDVEHELPYESDAVQLFWHESRYWGLKAMEQAREVWAMRAKASKESGATGKDLDVLLQENYRYKAAISDEQFYERLTNMFTNLVIAGRAMEERDVKPKYALADKPRRPAGH